VIFHLQTSYVLELNRTTVSTLIICEYMLVYVSICDYVLVYVSICDYVLVYVSICEYMLV